MTAVRLYNVQVVGTVTSTTTVRIYNLQLVGTPKLAQTIRIYKVQVVGTPGARVLPLPNLVKNPENLVTYTAALAGGGSADSWTHRVESTTGDEVVLTGTGATRSFYAPSPAPGVASATCRIGVKATTGGLDSPEVFFTVTTGPQSSWFLHPTKGPMGAIGH